MIPSASLVFDSFTLGVNNGNSIVWLYFVLGVINLFIESIFYIIVNTLAANSIAISDHPFLSFEAAPALILVLMSTYSFVIAAFLLYFDTWTIEILIVFHFALAVYAAVINRYMPFFKTYTNGILIGFYVGLAANDILAFIAYFIPNFPPYVMYYFGVCSIILCQIIFVIYCQIRKKKIVRYLRQINDEMAEDAKTDYYMSLKLDKDEKKAIMYLRIGFCNMSPVFLDFSFTQFILKNHTSEDALCNTMKVVTFIPSMSRLLNLAQGLVVQKRTLNYTHRFLMFEVYKIKALRQCSTSLLATTKLNELKTLSRHCESLVRGIWDATTIEPSFYEELASTCNNVRSQWEETIQNNRNSVRFYEQFCRYLVECETDFPAALVMKRKAEMIDLGRNFSIDYSFRSMISVFPQYIKKDVLDLKGNIKKKNLGRGNGSQNSSGSNKSYQNSDESNLDDDLEEFLGKKTFSQAKIRLALHHALENKLPRSIKCIRPMAIIMILIVLAVYFFILGYSMVIIKTQTKSMERLDYISSTRFYIALSNIQIILQYSIESGFILKYLPYITSLVDRTDRSYIVLGTTYLPAILNWTRQANENFQYLVNNLAELANTGEDIFSMLEPFTEAKFGSNICDNTGTVATFQDLSISNLISMTVIYQRIFSGYGTVSDKMTNDVYCELSQNADFIQQGTTELFNNFCDYQKEKSKEVEKAFNLISIIIPVCLFVVVIVPYIIVHFMSRSALNEISRIIESFDNKTKAEAKELISINIDSEETKIGEVIKKGTARSNVYTVFIVIITLGFLAISIAMTMIASNTNTDIVHLNTWDQFASLRLSLSCETINYLVFGLILQDNPGLSQTSDALIEALAAEATLESLVKANQDLVQGTEDSVPCSGFDDLLDQYNIVDNPVDPDTMDIHTLYSQSSLNQQISMFNDFVTSCLNGLMTGTEPTPSDAAHALHMANSHMWPMMKDTSDRLMELASVGYDNLIMTLGLLFIPTFVLILAYALLMYIYYINRSHAYKAGLFIIKRVPPISLINNKLFMSTFLNIHDEAKEEKLTVAGSVIHNANDAIFCTSLNGIVEIVNTSVTTLLGYTPEQLLGQPVNAFFTSQDDDKISQQLELMRNGQSSTFFEDNFTAMTDASVLVPCLVTILGMKSSGSSEVKSFVVIIRDQTALTTQQKQAEEAKKRSEKLLFQILPRDIVVKLNRGEKDISFSVASATIIFIDIVKFSEYSASLTPQEIMGNLSYYFAALDRIISKYKLLTKIKLIGDIYMAAAGLFNPESPPETHAEQTIRFALDTLLDLDDINMKLNASLTIRIGVNTGGPIIAGVLGKDKPVFDIIGDPINVAARLQTTDEPNRIQIPSSTYDLIKGSNFNIEERGEVFLKGKGQTMTYFVTPSSSLFQQISANEFNVN